MNAEAQEKESRRSKGPPRLRLHIVKRIKLLLLINTVPIIVAIGLIIGYYNGMVHIVGFESGKHDFAAFVIIGSCILVGISWWILIPITKWLYHYPRWYFRRESKALWFLPFASGAIIYFCTWLLCLMAAFVSCLAIISMIYYVLWGNPMDDASKHNNQQNNQHNSQPHSNSPP